MGQPTSSSTASPVPRIRRSSVGGTEPSGERPVPGDDDDDDGEEEGEANSSRASLPDGWIAAVDPASGRTYYCNEVTGESSWDRPSVANEDADDGVVGNDVDDGHGPNVVEDAGGRFEETEESIGGDAPLLSSEEPTADVGDAAVVEADDSFEEPTPNADNDAAAQENEPSVKDDDGQRPERNDKSLDDDHNLPPEWIELTDPASGQVYYYNRETSESSWERPARVLPSSERDGAGDEEGATEERASDGPSPSVASSSAIAASERDRSIDPAEEEEKRFDSTNNDASSTTIDGASMKSEVDERQEQLSGVANGHSTGADATTEVVDKAEGFATALPYPDAAAEDCDDGPAGAAEQPVGPSTPDREDVDGAQKNDDDTIAPLPEGWFKAADEASGSAYYYNPTTGESSWVRPNAAVADALDSAEPAAPAAAESSKRDVKEGGDGPAGGGDADVITGVAPPSPAASALPPGWNEAVDPTSGKTYYYNEATGDSSWERP